MRDEALIDAQGRNPDTGAADSRRLSGRRMYARFRNRRQPASALHERELRLNLSYVLHEHSESDIVARLAAACSDHARWAATAPPALARPRAKLGGAPDAIDCWLTAQIGLPRLLAQALRRGAKTDSRIVWVDGPCEHPTLVEFFRAPAMLCLPDAGAERIGVAVLVARPGRASTQLETYGPFRWPGERAAALRALERCLQRHAGQWLPQRPLWEATAEVGLTGEVGQFRS